MLVCLGSISRPVSMFSCCPSFLSQQISTRSLYFWSSSLFPVGVHLIVTLEMEVGDIPHIPHTCLIFEVLTQVVLTHSLSILLRLFQGARSCNAPFFSLLVPVFFLFDRGFAGSSSSTYELFLDEGHHLSGWEFTRRISTIL